MLYVIQITEFNSWTNWHCCWHSDSKSIQNDFYYLVDLNQVSFRHFDNSIAKNYVYNETSALVNFRLYLRMQSKPSCYSISMYTAREHCTKEKKKKKPHTIAILSSSFIFDCHNLRYAFIQLSSGIAFKRSCSIVKTHDIQLAKIMFISYAFFSAHIFLVVELGTLFFPNAPRTEILGSLSLSLRGVRTNKCQ